MRYVRIIDGTPSGPGYENASLASKPRGKDAADARVLAVTLLANSRRLGAVLAQGKCIDGAAQFRTNRALDRAWVEIVCRWARLAGPSGTRSLSLWPPLPAGAPLAGASAMNLPQHERESGSRIRGACKQGLMTITLRGQVAVADPYAYPPARGDASLLLTGRRAEHDSLPLGRAAQMDIRPAGRGGRLSFHIQTRQHPRFRAKHRAQPPRAKCPAGKREPCGKIAAIGQTARLRLGREPYVPAAACPSGRAGKRQL